MERISERISQMKLWIEDSLWAVRNCISFRFIHYDDNIDRLAFFEELNCGWYQMYIYPYDDLYMPIISEERKKRLGEFPQQYTFYVSEVDYDAIMEALDKPPQPSEALRKLFERKLPWDNSHQNNTN
jgi:hypothetical protein